MFLLLGINIFRKVLSTFSVNFTLYTNIFIKKLIKFSHKQIFSLTFQISIMNVTQVVKLTFNVNDQYRIKARYNVQALLLNIQAIYLVYLTFYSKS